MRVIVKLQNEDETVEGFSQDSVSVNDIEDLMTEIQSAKDKVESESGFSFDDEFELIEEGNNSLQIVSNGVDCEEKLIFKISNFKNKVDQDEVRDYIISN